MVAQGLQCYGFGRSRSWESGANVDPASGPRREAQRLAQNPVPSRQFIP